VAATAPAPPRYNKTLRARIRAQRPFFFDRNVSDQSKQAPSERKSLSVDRLESAIDQQIREAMERGEFDHLPGHGKPLDLARDPNVPPDWELAFNLLKNAGFAPDWIEVRKELRDARDKLFAPLERFLANPPASQSERARQQAILIGQFRPQAAELNRIVDTYNLKAPTPQVHLRRVRIEHEVESFNLKCKKLADS
jgi:DnaJ homolog subfamily C member 28